MFVAVTNALKTKSFPNLQRGKEWSGQHAEHTEPGRMGLLSNCGDDKRGTAQSRGSS